MQKERIPLEYLYLDDMQVKQCKWTFRSLRSFKDHLWAHCKPAYQRQVKRPL